ncbi:helix-turn-helix domain-containing protein [Beijerinckia sp. L45]|uniref:helix-turn-helix domain-containing protein n=1 Tax=Beijerinckia sp. L45 TaxID=1641855 RepID=UPI00131B1536|nr:helix-turn-helix domain-containing protein [Beijerinckia sp. L45]
MILVAPALHESPAAKIASLEAENAALRDRLAQIEQDLLGSAIVTPSFWGLTRMEERVFALLLMRVRVKQDQVLTAIYSDLNKEPGYRIVDVYVCKLRRKLGRFGITIRTLPTLGYAIDEPLRGMLRQALSPDTSAVEERRLLTLIAEGALAA